MPAATSQGRRDWLTGARQLKGGLAQFVTALHDVELGQSTAARSNFFAAVKTINAEESVRRRADRELGGPELTPQSTPPDRRVGC